MYFVLRKKCLNYKRENSDLSQKMILNKFILLTLLVLSSLTGWSQVTDLLKSRIELALISYYNAQGSIISDLPIYKNKAFSFGFSIFINQRGKIDSITFTNKSKTLDSLISFGNIEKRIRTQEDLFLGHKNSIMVGIALVRNHEDTKIENLYDNIVKGSNPALVDFDNSFYKMLPFIPDKDPRKIYLLPAFSLVQVRGKP